MTLREMTSFKLKVISWVVFCLVIMGCSPTEQGATSESQQAAPQKVGVTDSLAVQDFEPQYIGGYPTEETAERMFEEYDYQAAVQFYVWAYAYLNGLGLDFRVRKEAMQARLSAASKTAASISISVLRHPKTTSRTGSRRNRARVG